MSAITAIKIAGQILAEGSTVSIALAGKTIDVVGGEDKPLGPVYLYGPGRKDPLTQAMLKSMVMPSPLPAGNYTFKAQRRGEGSKDYYVLNFAVSAPATVPPKPDKPTNDGDPTPVVPGDEDEKPRLTGKMKIGLVDASAQSLALTRPLVEPLKLHSLAPWVDTGGFGAYRRDSEVASVIELAAALNLTPLWRCAEGHLTRDEAIAGAQKWHLAHAADMIAATDASPLKGQPVRIQIGNEPDNDTEYWDAGETSYVRDYLVPVAKALGGKFGDRVFIVAGGWSWNIGTLEQLADEIAPVVDAFAFHGYPTTDYGPLTRAVKLAHDRGKSLIRSEGNRGDGKAYKKLADTAKPAALAKWARLVGSDLVKSEQLGVDEYLYFIAYDHGTTASPARLFDVVKKAGKVVALQPTAFYEALKAVIA